MTQDDTSPFKSTRVNSVEPDVFDQSQPRIGRRESEPHSLEVAYLHDVLAANFPQHHTLLDLHHYFQHGDDEIDVQFDISFFLDFTLPYTLSSYRAADHNNRIPALAINILSKSTWRADLSENLDICRLLRIPAYVVFAPFDVATRFYHPPFLRVYQLQEGGSYSIEERRDSCVDEGGRMIDAELVSLGGNIPLRVGIEQLEGKHEKTQHRFRLILVEKDVSTRLLTKLEQERTRGDKEKDRADLEKARADKLERLLKDHGIDI
jgi:Uma2 family endonuclease